MTSNWLMSSGSGVESIFFGLGFRLRLFWLVHKGRRRRQHGDNFIDRSSGSSKIDDRRIGGGLDDASVSDH